VCQRAGEIKLLVLVNGCGKPVAFRDALLPVRRDYCGAGLWALFFLPAIANIINKKQNTRKALGKNYEL
jgi:hypothetical protein